MLTGEYAAIKVYNDLEDGDDASAHVTAVLDRFKADGDMHAQ